ncbi:glycosyltransferase [Anabaena azotica]|uniref:glycosyltransferase n=1 Tax=Anabaena azotica TaxID=197653 RepID=UPI0039A673A7
MPKFVIIDQSLRNLGGHHYEYDISVAEAAKKIGYEPIIISHKQFPSYLYPQDINLIAIFTQDWTGTLFSEASLIGRLITLVKNFNNSKFLLKQETRLILKIIYDYLFISLPNLQSLWPKFKEINFLLKSALKSDVIKLAIPLYVIIKLLLKTKKILIHILPVKTIILLIKIPIKLVKIILESNINTIIKFIHHYKLQQERIFAKNLKVLFKKINLTAQDHIFIHTISVEQLEELFNFLAANNSESTPHCHILLRRDYYEQIVINAKGIGLKACLNRFYGSGLYPTSVTFYTDTDELTLQHNRLSPIRFITAPIPFRHEKIKERSISCDYTTEAINIVYLGDARSEKGYQYLPQLVDALWLSHILPGKIRFKIQSNFNLDGGEPGIKEARLKLEQYPSSKIQLFKEILSTEAYYDLLSSADIIVIPYSPECYGARSSGVLVEALVAGKPVVVPANSWMAAQVDDSRASIYESPNQMADAVLRILNNWQQITQAALEYSLFWRAKHSPDTLVKCLVQQKNNSLTFSPSVEQSAPSIVYIIDADSIVNNTGSGQVARSHLDYLSRCGYRIYGIFFFYDAKLSEDEFSYQVSVAKKKLAPFNVIESWFLKYKLPLLSNIFDNVSYITSRIKGQPSLQSDLFGRSNLEVTSDLADFLKNQKIDAVLLNYISSWSIIEKLGLKQHHIICEMHDIQSHQYAFYNNRGIASQEWELECNLLNKCEVLLVNNLQELEKVKESVQKPSLYHVPYIGRLYPLQYSDLSGCFNLLDILKLSGSDILENYAQNERIKQENSLDLLFVSSYHAPNVLSLRWFFYEVYLPYLADKNINLFIVGNIMKSGDLKDITHPKVFIAGEVKTLRPLYAATRLVILPVKIGAGFNIKTIEALSMGKPVVATSTALRGIDFERDAFPVFDEPKAYADQILKLLNNSQMRLEVAKKGFEIVKTGYRQENFDASMNAAFRHIFKERILLPRPLESVSWKPQLVELSPETLLLNRIIEPFLNRDDFGHDNFCKELYDQILSSYSYQLMGQNVSRINLEDINKYNDLPANENFKHICILIHQDIGYLSPTIKLVADQIVEEGISVDIFCLTFEKKYELQQKHKFRIISYPTTLNEYTKAGKTEFIAKAITQLKGYDAYIGINETALAATYFLAKILFNKPLIGYMLEIPTIKDDFDKYIDSLLNKVNAFIDVDPGRLHYRNKQFPITDTQFYIRNFPRQKEVNEIVSSKKITTNSSTILWYHGTISIYHGITEILDGYYKSKLATELHLTGPFLDVEYEKELITRINSGNKPVFLHQPVHRDMVLKRAFEYADIAICFYPYRYSNPQDYLGRLYANPAKIFDYMALGIPTIASDNPSLIDYIQKEGWGLCVPPEDAEAVGEAIDLLVSDPQLRLKMSQTARELFAVKYNLEQEVKPFMNWLTTYLKDSY